MESISKSLKKATTKFFANSDIVDLDQLDLAISVTLFQVVVSAASLNDLVGAQQKRLGES